MTHVTGVPRRRLSRWLVLSLAGVVGLTLSACAGNASGPGSQSSGTAAVRTADPGKSVSDKEIPLLNVGIVGQIATLNPLENIAAGMYVNNLGLETLLRIDMNGDLQPWLATSFDQKSDTVYEYTLREGVKFWDGSEMTSEDVKAAWDLRLPGAVKPSQSFLGVAGIEATDKYTVLVTLTQPDASWKFVPAQFYSVIFENEFYKNNTETFGQPGTLLVGTGPWEINSLNPTTGMELTANPDYWGGKPPIDKISVKSFADDNGMALALRAGEIDLTPMVNGPKGFDAAAGGGTTSTVPTCSSALLSMPTTTEPWDDIHVRRAVAHAINRNDIIAATGGRAGAPLETLISPILLKSIGSDNEVDAALGTVPTYEHDLTKAKAEMAQSKVPDGFKDTIFVTQSTAAVGQVIAAQLKEIGIDMEVKSMAGTAWTASVTGPPNERPLTWTETGACSSPDPSLSSMWLGVGPDGKASTLNIANYTPPEVDDLLKQGKLAQDPAERLKIYTELLQRLGEDVPYVPLYAEGATLASKKYDIVDYNSFWVSTPWALNVVPK